MNNFFLFRIKSQQHKNLFSKEIKPSKLIRAAIEEYTNQNIENSQIWKNQVWRIGNIENIGDEGLYFAFGRDLKSKREFYDDEIKEFKEKEEIETPHAYVFISFKYQVCAIALHTIIALKPQTLANKLGKVLSSTKFCKDNEASIIIPAIDDPHAFISLIDKAEFITKFHMTFDLPNPVDTDQFHREMEEMLEYINGNKGQTIMTGDDLEKEKLKSMSHSLASTGSELKARMKLPKEDKPRIVKMSKNQSVVQAEGVDTMKEKEGILKKIEKSYHDIRGGVDD